MDWPRIRKKKVLLAVLLANFLCFPVIAQITEPIPYLGVFSNSLDSLTLETLNGFVKTQIHSKEYFDLKDYSALYPLASRDYRFKGKLTRLSTLAPPEVTQLIYATFERQGEHYLCKLWEHQLRPDRIKPIGEIPLHNEVAEHIRTAAIPIVESLSRHFGYSGERGADIKPVFSLSQPIVQSVLTRGDVLLKLDSITDITSGTRLYLGKKAPIQYIKGKKIKYILHPGSTYHFIAPSMVDVREGVLGMVMLNYNAFVYTDNLLCSANTVIMEVKHQAGESEVLIFGGQARISPLGSDTAHMTLTARTLGISRGYKIKKGSPSETDFTLRFTPFAPLMSADIIPFFKTTQLIKKYAEKKLDFLAQARELSLEHFIYREFAELGIEVEALELGGDSFDDGTRIFETGAQNLGCYLCEPHRVTK